MEGFSGAILAGGSGSRFNGTVKSKLIIQGDTIISRVLDVIGGTFNEKIIVTNTPEEFLEFKSCIVVSDYFEKAGPLAGIHAALKASSSEAVFVFAGDMPFLDREIINYQVSEFIKRKYETLVPRSGNLTEPLHAIYSISIIPALERFIIEGRSRAIRDFLSEINTGYLDFPESANLKKAFTNINRPEDLSDLDL
jgi:molybdenum cofactor guanylyltransferase